MTREGEELRLDFGRKGRIGLPEAVFCAGKSARQIDAILAAATEREVDLLLTRLGESKFAELDPKRRADLDFCAISGTAVLGAMPPIAGRVPASLEGPTR